MQGLKRCNPCTCIGDLEAWPGWKDDSRVDREAKIWDRQGGSEGHLTIDVYVNGWYAVIDWRLRVKDNAAGDEGAVTEFHVLDGKIHFWKAPE